MTDLFNMLGAYLHDVFVIKFDGWVILGFVAQGFFTMRFVVQWIASERARKSVIPVAFWFFSIGGGVLLLVYALYRRDPVFIAGQALGLAGLYPQSVFHHRQRTAVVRLGLRCGRSVCANKKRDSNRVHRKQLAERQCSGASAAKSVQKYREWRPRPQSEIIALNAATFRAWKSSARIDRLVVDREGRRPGRPVRSDGESRPVPDRPARCRRGARQLPGDRSRRAGDCCENRAIGAGERVCRAADGGAIFHRGLCRRGPARDMAAAHRGRRSLHGDLDLRARRRRASKASADDGRIP